MLDQLDGSEAGDDRSDASGSSDALMMLPIEKLNERFVAQDLRRNTLMRNTGLNVDVNFDPSDAASTASSDDDDALMMLPADRLLGKPIRDKRNDGQ